MKTNFNPKEKLLVILGPTAVGKSALAIKLAHVFQGEIINCDSMQVYQGFDIGTDKIPPEKREGIPHHLLDVIPPTEQFTAADFVCFSLEIMQEIWSRNHLPIITGGTGLYLQSLLEGLFPGVGRNPQIRQKLEEEAQTQGLAFLWEKLAQVDPVYAQKISPRDKIRVIRALEVYEATGIPISRHFQKTKSFVRDFSTLKIGLKLKRKELYERINRRVERMFAAGLIEEVTRLLQQGIPEEAPPFRALGYKYALQVIQHQLSREEAIKLTQRDTRHYAKRQLTWFRRMKGIHWFSPYQSSQIIEFIKSKWITHEN
jgi:tRNA dimethylallyltransferase